MCSFNLLPYAKVKVTDLTVPSLPLYLKVNSVLLVASIANSPFTVGVILVDGVNIPVKAKGLAVVPLPRLIQLSVKQYFDNK